MCEIRMISGITLVVHILTALPVHLVAGTVTPAAAVPNATEDNVTERFNELLTTGLLAT